MAEKSTKAAENVSAESKQDMVRFKIPRDSSGRNKSDVFVGVNGKSYLVKRGVQTEMPRSVVEVLENAEEQMEVARDYQEQNSYTEIN